MDGSTCISLICFLVGRIISFVSVDRMHWYLLCLCKKKASSEVTDLVGNSCLLYNILNTIHTGIAEESGLLYYKLIL